MYFLTAFIISIVAIMALGWVVCRCEAKPN